MVHFSKMNVLFCFFLISFTLLVAVTFNYYSVHDMVGVGAESPQPLFPFLGCW